MQIINKFKNYFYNLFKLQKKHPFNYEDFSKLTKEEQKEYLDNCIDLEYEDEHKWRPSLLMV